MKNHLWIDIETDNLRTSGELLEIGAYITDAETFEFKGACSYVITPRYPKETLAQKLTKDAAEVHEESGLIGHLMHHSFERDEVQEDMMEFFGRYGEEGDFILAGRSMALAFPPWFPRVAGYCLQKKFLDLDGFSSVLAASGKSELEPLFEGDRKNRAGADAQILFHEFLYYKELLGFIEIEPE